MKIINEKQFLAELDEKFVLKEETLKTYSSDNIKNAESLLKYFKKGIRETLSKYLKDLPKKVYHDHKNPVWRPGEADAYNQCLEDCEKK